MVGDVATLVQTTAVSSNKSKTILSFCLVEILYLNPKLQPFTLDYEHFFVHLNVYNFLAQYLHSRFVVSIVNGNNEWLQWHYQMIHCIHFTIT
jgi:hypothetical protein